MKKLLFIAGCILLMCSCSKQEVKHDSPTFLVVVDSICNKYANENGYDETKVKKGMHEYVNYYGANENPILKDLPMKLESLTITDTKNGDKRVLACFSYDFEEPTKTGKRLYALHAFVHNTYGANDSVPLKEGDTYYIIPDKGIIQYDGRLDLVGIDEVQGGNINDSRSFGTLDINNASFTKAD